MSNSMNFVSLQLARLFTAAFEADFTATKKILNLCLCIYCKKMNYCAMRSLCRKDPII